MSEAPDLRLALHGPAAACHELHAEPGSFGVAVAALGRARAQEYRASVASWITRSSCRSLVELVELLVVHGAAGWVLAWPWVHDASAVAVARMVPRLGIAVPHALRAVERATRRGLPVAVVGVPSCALGPFAALRLSTGGPAGAHPAPCDGCPARTECPGVDPWYLDRFGSRELHPVAMVPRVERPASLARTLAAAAVELGSIA